MHIYHYTHYKDIPSIMENGLSSNFRDENWSDTLSINYPLEKYKPKNLPDCINRDKCVFFYPKNMYKCFLGDCFYRVDTESLNPELLYVASLSAAQEVYEHNCIEYYAKRYWDTLIPFNEYNKNNYSEEEVELLYFGEIPFEMLEVGCSVFPEYREFISKLLKQFKVESWCSRSRNVTLKNGEVYDIYLANESEIHVNTKNGSYFNSLTDFIEKNIDYKEKIMYYHDGVKTKYFGAKMRRA